MIKGINRQIIEVTDTGNVYYERALLVLKPEYSSAQRALLEREAKKVLKRMQVPSSVKQKRIFFHKIAKVAGAAALGSFLTLLIISIF